MSQTAKAIRTLLVAHSPLTDLVGTRIRVGRLGQNDTYPAIVFRQIVSTPNDHKGGASVADDELYQVTCIAETYVAGYAVSDLVRTVLDHVNQQTVSGVDIDGVRFMNEVAMPYDDKTDLIQIVQDYQIRVKR